MHRVSGITVFRCKTTRLARLVQTSAVMVRDYAFVGDNPIGMAHTSYGRFTYVNDSHGDRCARSTTPATRSSKNDQHLADDTRAEGAKTVPLAASRRK